jgi:antirestriction protein ArdC
MGTKHQNEGSGRFRPKQLRLEHDAARRQRFRGPPEWAATALHELGHWTGHQSRLNREEGMKARFGSSAYAMEELRAELASAFIAAEIGIPADIPQHASYISTWLKPLKEDKREIFRAAADAQKIVDMVLAFHPDFAASPSMPEKHAAAQLVHAPIL